MNFSSVAEFWAWCGTDEKPADIPARPDRTYPDEWIGWKGWLGTVNKPQRRRGKTKWRPFEEAREFVRSLGLKNSVEWKEWASSDQRPKDIPVGPSSAYADTGWKGMRDWLGNEWRPFEEAREYVRSLNLRGVEEWKTWAASDERPNDIPKAPENAYRDAGWRGFGDWLGKEWRRTPTVVCNDLVDALRLGEGVLHLEQTLLPPKLDLVRPDIHPGTLIYTHYVDGMIHPIRSFVERMGYRVGLYTGDDKTGLEDFLAGRVDVLIGSKPVGTGLDSLRIRCNKIVMLSLPWTSAEYEQIIGRVRRQGSAFGSARVIVPQVNLDHEGDVWSWDARRMDTIRFKRTLSDCALDGNIPEVARISPKELEDRGREALESWIERVREGEMTWRKR